MTFSPDDQQWLQQYWMWVDAFWNRSNYAWCPNVEFDRRIRDLPLYALDFNVVEGRPTAAFHVPFRAEMQAIAALVRQVGDGAKVCDVGCGNGFLGSLLAREGIDVFGIDDQSYEGRTAIDPFLDDSVYAGREGDVNNPDVTFDVGYCSWPVPGWDAAAALAAKSPRLIVLTLSTHRNGESALVTGVEASFAAPVGYELLTGWFTLRPESYYYAVCPGAFQEDKQQLLIRVVLVFAREGSDLEPILPSDDEPGYRWDEDRKRFNRIRAASGLLPYRLCSLAGIKGLMSASYLEREPVFARIFESS